MLTRPRRLLCIAETLNSGTPWLNKAEALARGFGATLELCAADVERFVSASWATQSGEVEYRAAVVARRQQDLARLVRPLRTRGVDARAGALLAAPLEHSVRAHAATSHPDLVIKSARHGPGAPAVGLLQADWMLARALGASLLLAGGRPWPDQPPVAVIAEDADGGVSEPTLTAAQRLCSALGGTCERVPTRWSEVSRLIDYLRNRGASVVAMPDTALHCLDAAARILEELGADLLIIPACT
jgi:hypothetical protein